MLKNNLVQLIEESTHKYGNTLDLLVAPNVNNIVTLEVREPFNDKADHNVIIVVFSLPKSQENTNNSVKKNFYKADFCAINNFLCSVDWKRLLNDTDIESNYIKFIEVLQDCIDWFVPNSFIRKKAFGPKHLKALRVQK